MFKKEVEVHLKCSGICHRGHISIKSWCQEHNNNNDKKKTLKLNGRILTCSRHKLTAHLALNNNHLSTH